MIDAKDYLMKKLIVGLFASLLLAACGGDNTLSGNAASSGSNSSGGSTSNSSATAAVQSVTIVSNVSTVPSDGSSGATVTAFVRDANNHLLDGVVVTFVASSGGITSSSITSNGAATANLITAGDSTPRTITVTAVAGGVSAATTVQVVSASSSNTVQLGSGIGSAFHAGVLDVGLTSAQTLSAGGTTNLTATLVQSDQSLYTGSVSVTFSSACLAAGTAIIQGGATVATTTGSVVVTYVAQGCAPTDTITARATVGGNALSATGSLTIAQATVGSIIFVSATPSSVALKGAGTTTMPETSRVKFQVLDSQNNPLPAKGVTFSLNTSVGGVALSQTTATSDSSGFVEAIVNSGTVATSVRVTAVVATTTIATQSSNLTITTGLPDQDSFSLALTCNNLETWDYQGVTTGATVYLADRYNNPVPDDTAITFQTEAGDIGSACVTSGGTCSVTWRSSGTRPSNGRVSILATAIGEETFGDVNGNGKFDTGDTFTNVDEPFEDNNENGLYDSGEPFRDFNLNGVYDSASVDTKFNGICSTADSAFCSSNQSAAIGAKAVVIMSGNTGFIKVRSANDYVDGFSSASDVSAISLTNSVSTFYVAVFDLHGNPMPAGTTVSISTTNGALSGTTSYTLGCTDQPIYTYTPGTTLFPVKIAGDATVSNGALTIKVTTPRGTVTTLDIDVGD
jgi:hypothetical protein